MASLNLSERSTGGGSVREVTHGCWRMEIPEGARGVYRWAQLDDYLGLRRGRFLWRAPLRVDLRARVSADGLPGTWGFGFWNDPFTASLGLGGMTARLPALPNAAWFFHAGAPNYLAFRDTHPAQGLLAATFASPRIPSILLAPGALALPLLLVRPAARLLRRATAALIAESAALVTGDPVAWGAYRIEWRQDRVIFSVDGNAIAATPASPHGPLGFVAWIDNQYAAFLPSGEARAGTSANPQAWLEIKDLQIR